MGLAVAPAALLILIAATAAPAVDGPSADSRPKKKKAAPVLKLDRIGAPLLLSDGRAQSLSATVRPSDGLVAPPRYIVGREGNATTGRRATVSFDLGDTRVFAVGGKLRPRMRSGAAEEAARTSAQRKLESGKLYGAGVERKVGPIGVAAEYQFSTINAHELDPSAAGPSFLGLEPDGSHKSHSVKATAKLRF